GRADGHHPVVQETSFGGRRGEHPEDGPGADSACGCAPSVPFEPAYGHPRGQAPRGAKVDARGNTPRCGRDALYDAKVDAAARTPNGTPPIARSNGEGQQVDGPEENVYGRHQAGRRPHPESLYGVRGGAVGKAPSHPESPYGEGGRPAPPPLPKESPYGAKALCPAESPYGDGGRPAPPPVPNESPYGVRKNSNVMWQPQDSPYGTRNGSQFVSPPQESPYGTRNGAQFVSPPQESHYGTRNGAQFVSPPQESPY
ncbi:translation initiation factor IF-2-like, partial [Frankliniella occidentalis]|uniref:Translation initiation factor IF-2-like n=1 Tax=Frankliniella occidentalis TaxID=133901 RepID=A0A9C6XD43_FRAOC